MPRRPATITQADVARVTRAAKQAGAAEVEVLPDGRILIRMESSTMAADAPIEEKAGIVL